MISHLGAMISVVNGVLLAHRFKGIRDSAGAACIGDGGPALNASEKQSIQDWINVYNKAQ